MATPVSSLRASRAEPARAPPGALKLALMGLAGAAIEWYDFFLYATAAALVFPRVFFPSTLPPLIGVIASFSTFAVGFLARPIGAVLFGHVGDKTGRKTALVIALVTMGIATTLIGVLPTYHSAGVFSPLALVLLRVTQGLAVGGQWGGAILLATENAPDSRRGLYGSIVQASVPAGVVLANLALLIANGTTSPAAFLSYGWRIPFLLSFGLVILGIFIHYRVADTAAYRRLQAQASPAASPREQRRSPVLESIRLYPKMILLAAGAYVSTNLSFYILITYVVAYGTSTAGLHLPRATLLAAVLIANVASTPMLFLAGSLSDRFGRRRVYVTGVTLGAVWAFILFPLIETRSLLWITVAIFLGASLNSLSYGPLAAMFTELFDTAVRYSAASLAYQIGAILGGGFAPMIATALYARFHSNIGVSAYIAGACAVSLVCASLLREAPAADPDPVAVHPPKPAVGIVPT
jgi:MFS family permease